MDAAAPEPATSITSVMQRIKSFQYSYRSARSLWTTRKLGAKLELTLHGCLIHLSESSEGGNGLTKHRELSWQDVLGAHLLTKDGEHLDLSTSEAAKAWRTANKQTSQLLLGLYACPAKQSDPHSLKKRNLVEWFYEFQVEEVEHVVAVMQWINFLADPRSSELLEHAKSLDDVELVQFPRRKFMVIINPVGGKGNSLQMYESKVLPVFRYANIDAEVVKTERAAHGTEIMRNLPLDTYDCVLTVGGDGSLFEAFQGLMQRPDWNKAVRQPIGIIPGGSGNGLATSVLHQNLEKPKPVNAAFVLAKGMPHDLDITAVRNGKETMYSFLSFEWALIADVDIESEKFRAIGGMRFAVVFAQHIFFTRKDYSGTVWYLDDDDEAADEGATEQSCKAPPARYFDTHDPSSSERPAFDLIDNENSGKWKELKGHFKIFWIMNVSHASTDSMVAPGAQLDDGYNYIMYLPGDQDRMELVNMLTSIENGEHLDKSNAKLLRTRAFKIQSDREDDLMCIDGELFDGPCVEGQVHRGLGRIMALPPTPARQTRPATQAPVPVP